MNESYLDDDGGLSSDFTVVEVTAEEVTPQSLWIGVRLIFLGNVQSEKPMIQICYQEEHMNGPLSGPVWIEPSVWRELNKAVEWRLRRRSGWRTRVRGVLRRR